MPAGPERRPVSGEPVHRRADLARPGDAGDPLVAAVDQVLDAFARAVLVVDQHGVRLDAVDPAVDQHHRDLRVREQLDAFGRTGRGDHHTGHLLGQRCRRVRRFLRRVLVGVAQHHVVALALGDVLDAADQRGEERVLDVGDDHGPQVRAGLAQVAGDAVRAVAELGDRGADLLGQLRIHVAPPAQHPRDGGRRHAGSTRDVVDRRHPRSPLEVRWSSGSHSSPDPEQSGRVSGQGSRSGVGPVIGPGGVRPAYQAVRSVRITGEDVGFAAAGFPGGAVARGVRTRWMASGVRGRRKSRRWRRKGGETNWPG